MTQNTANVSLSDCSIIDFELDVLVRQKGSIQEVEQLKLLARVEEAAGNQPILAELTPGVPQDLSKHQPLRFLQAAIQNLFLDWYKHRIPDPVFEFRSFEPAAGHRPQRPASFLYGPIKFWILEKSEQRQNAAESGDNHSSP